MLVPLDCAQSKLVGSGNCANHRESLGGSLFKESKYYIQITLQWANLLMLASGGGGEFDRLVAGDAAKLRRAGLVQVRIFHLHVVAGHAVEASSDGRKGGQRRCSRR